MLRSKSLFFWSALFAVLLLTYVSVGAQDLVVSDSLVISSDTTFDNVRILDGGVLIADAQVDVLMNMLIDSGGVVTHSSRHLDGLILNVTDTLVIHSGGMIDLTAKGLRGGLNGSAFGLDGETFDSTGAIVAGAGGGQPGGSDGGAGGSYGGWGATAVGVATAPYGLLESPSHLGSGGGGYQYEGRRGGNGGGRLRLAAEVCLVDGVIRANGGNHDYLGGGGSGGGIRLDVGSLSGAGRIEANGEEGTDWYGSLSGAGGGGRIAVYYDNMSVPDTSITAYGHDLGPNSSAGTIYFKDNAESYGTLIVDNGGVVLQLLSPLLSELTDFKEITIRHGGGLDVMPDDMPSFTVTDRVLLHDAAALELDSGVTMTVSNSSGFDVDVESSSSLVLHNGCQLNANAVRLGGGILNTSIDLSFPTGSDLEFSNGGTINVLDSTTFSMEFFDPTNIQSGTLNLTSGSVLDIAADRLEVGTGAVSYTHLRAHET